MWLVRMVVPWDEPGAASCFAQLTVSGSAGTYSVPSWLSRCEVTLACTPPGCAGVPIGMSIATGTPGLTAGSRACRLLAAMTAARSAGGKAANPTAGSVLGASLPAIAEGSGPDPALGPESVPAVVPRATEMAPISTAIEPRTTSRRRARPGSVRTSPGRPQACEQTRCAAEQHQHRAPGLQAGVGDRRAQPRADPGPGRRGAARRAHARGRNAGAAR